MLIKQITREQVGYLSEEILVLCDPLFLERGFEYNHKGKVYNVEVMDGSLVKAKVQETTNTYDVQLDLDFVGVSQCSCHLRSHCSHLAAVFFHLYAIYHRPEWFLKQVKEAKQAAEEKRVLELERKKAEKAKQTRSFEFSGMNRSTRSSNRGMVIPKQPLVAEPREQDSVSDWCHYFAEMDSQEAFGQWFHVNIFYNTVSGMLPRCAAKWVSHVKALYNVHVILFLLEKLVELNKAKKPGSVLQEFFDFQFENVADECLNKLRDWTSKVDWTSSDDRYRSQLAETVERIASLSQRGAETPVHWQEVYRLFWFSISGDMTWTKSEMQRWQNELQSPLISAADQDNAHLVLMQFHLKLGHDEAAEEHYIQFINKRVEDLIGYVDYFAETDQHDRHLYWLRQISTLALQLESYAELDSLCNHWEKAAEYTNSDEERLQFIVSMFPKTHEYYIDALLQAKRYELWADFMLFYNDAFNLQLELPYELQDLEQPEHVELLLPLYHQSIERNILLKRRNSYEAAAEQLQELAKLYGRIRQKLRFDDYIERLIKLYGRFRAFQEALRRRKLIG